MSVRTAVLRAMAVLGSTITLLIVTIQTSPAQDYRLPRFPDPEWGSEIEADPMPDYDPAFQNTVIYDDPTEESLNVDAGNLKSNPDTEESLYIGPATLESWRGSIDLSAGLGTVVVDGPVLAAGDVSIGAGTYLKVMGEIGTGGSIICLDSLYAKGDIRARGSMIFAGQLYSGSSIRCDGEIVADSIYSIDGIRSDTAITSNSYITSLGIVSSEGEMSAKWGIEGMQIFGGNISAGGGITSEGRIECDDLEAGDGIVAWDLIKVSGTISCGKRIFCGIDTEFTGDNPVHRTITCSKLLSGEVAYGILVETGGDTTAE